MRRFAWLSVVVLALGGCSSAAYYKEAARNETHAILKFSKSGLPVDEHFQGMEVRPIKINGMPPNHWAKWTMESFRIRPGAIRLIASAHAYKGIEAIVIVNFEADQDRTYYVSRTVHEGYVEVTVTDDAGNRVARDRTKINIPPRLFFYQGT